MRVGELITVIREDYLNDKNSRKYRWDDASLLRRIDEAQRQACNRTNLIYDDSTSLFTRIAMVSGKPGYKFSDKITVIKNVLLGGKILNKRSVESMDKETPLWRANSGQVNQTVEYVIQGRTLRVTFIPNDLDVVVTPYINLEVYRLPDNTINNVNQQFEIPEENQLDLAHWVLHSCYKKVDADTFNQEKSDYHLLRFNQIFGQPVSALVRQHQFESTGSLNITPAGLKRHRSTSDDPAEW